MKGINISWLKSFTIFLGILSITFDVWGGERKGVLPILIGTVAGGVGTTTTFTQQFCPQIIYFSTTANPDINIKVSGDGTIWDIPGIGVNEFATVRQYGRTTNFYEIQLASGLVKNKMTTFTITNQTATAFNVYAASKRSPGQSDLMYFCANSQVLLASSGFTFGNFMYLSFANAGATDRYVITYADGTSQPYDSRDELKAMIQLYQNSISSTGYNIDNIANEIRTVQATPAAQQTAYVYYPAVVGKPIVNAASLYQPAN